MRARFIARLGILLIGVAVCPSMAHASEITAQIVDNTGEGLTGATVRVDGTNQGVVADIDGNFTIKPESGAKSITITYIGMKSQTFPIDEVPSVITLQDDTTALDEVVVAACGKSALNELHATQGIFSKTSNKCIPTACITNYELSGQEYLKDEDGEYELDDDGQKILVQSECIDTNGRDCSPMPENAKIAKLENGQCVIKKCNEPQYKLESGECVNQVGKDCTSRASHAVAASYQMVNGESKCIISKCDEPGWVRDEAGTKCEESDGPCTATQLAAVAHATLGSLRKGQCIITECEKGWHVKDGTSCEQAELSEQDSKNKVSDLKDNAQKMKDKEQSTANKVLGAAAIGATGIGGMNLMEGMAQQKADDAAEQDMKAYLATFVCDYGQGRNIKGGERAIDLPGGNELFAQVNEYKALATDLKVRKEALGKTPGIESEIIYDIAETGLYDNVGLGRQKGAYTSLSRALMDENSADAAEWAQQKADAKSKVKTGAITAGAGAIGGLVGNLAINSGDKNKNKVDEINKKYDNLKRQVQNSNVTNVAADTNGRTSVARKQDAVLADAGAASASAELTADRECVNNSDCITGKCAEGKCIVSEVEVAETFVTGNQIYGFVFSKTVPGADVFPDTFKTVIKDSNDTYVTQNVTMTVVPKSTNLSFDDFQSQEMVNCIELQTRWTNKTANCYNDRKAYVYNVALLCPKEGTGFVIEPRLRGITYDYYLEGNGVSAKIQADAVYNPNSNTGNDIRYEDGAKNIFGYNNNILISDPDRDFPINPDFHGTEYSKCNQTDIQYTTIMQIWPKTGLLTADMLSNNFEIKNFTFAEKTELPRR